MNTSVALARSAVHIDKMRNASKDLNPLLQLVVVTCADHRVDPTHILGLEPSEAIVLRNPGGRITRDLLRSLTVLSTVASIEDVNADLDFLVLHHTDCGMSRLTSPEHAQLVADFVGVGPAEVADLALANPRESVEYDARLLAAMLSGPGSTVTGAVYDLETGAVEIAYSTAHGPEAGGQVG